MPQHSRRGQRTRARRHSGTRPGDEFPRLLKVVATARVALGAGEAVLAVLARVGASAVLAASDALGLTADDGARAGGAGEGTVVGTSRRANGQGGNRASGKDES